MRRTPAATPLSPTDRDQADVAGAPHMRAAAQLDRPAHVSLPQLARPSRPRAPRRRISRRTARARRTRRASSSAISRVVTGAFCSTTSLAMSSTRSSSSARHRLGMREVEAQPVGRDQRALLRDVVAEHLAQRLVQQMRRRMVGADGASAARDRRRAAAASPTLSVPCSTVTEMHEQVAGFLLRVGDARARRRRARHRAGVADLAAGLRHRTASG